MTTNNNLQITETTNTDGWYADNFKTPFIWAGILVFVSMLFAAYIRHKLRAFLSQVGSLSSSSNSIADVMCKKCNFPVAFTWLELVPKLISVLCQYWFVLFFIINTWSYYSEYPWFRWYQVGLLYWETLSLPFAFWSKYQQATKSHSILTGFSKIILSFCQVNAWIAICGLILEQHVPTELSRNLMRWLTVGATSILGFIISTVLCCGCFEYKMTGYSIILIFFAAAGTAAYSMASTKSRGLPEITDWMDGELTIMYAVMKGIFIALHFLKTVLTLLYKRKLKELLELYPRYYDLMMLGLLLVRLRVTVAVLNSIHRNQINEAHANYNQLVEEGDRLESTVDRLVRRFFQEKQQVEKRISDLQDLLF